jgi:hypothetical protein
MDIAYPQLEYGDGSPKPVNYDQLATAADAFWVRWTSYRWWLENGRKGADSQYNVAMSALKARGKPAGPYMYAGAGFGVSAKTQVDDWAAATQVQPTWPPMYDLEVVGITGDALTAWVNAVLARMTETWGLKPILYLPWDAPGNWGIKRPSVEHWLMVPEYPNIAPTWANRAQWEAMAYGRPGFANGPDTPFGDWDVWQALHTATGIPGLDPNQAVDVSFVKDRVFDGLTLAPASVPSAAQEEEDMAKQVINKGTVYAVSGMFKTPINSDQVRLEWMKLGLLTGPVLPITDAAFAELVEVNPGSFPIGTR